MKKGIDRLQILAEEQEPPPREEPPKQKLPEWLKWPIRLLFLPFLMLDIAIEKFMRRVIRPPYVMKGACKRRGNCCRYILMTKPSDWIQRLYLLWHTEMNGFYERQMPPIEREDGSKMLVLTCRHLGKDNLCKRHWCRPGICRRWPIIEQFGEPRFLRGCGFYAELRNQEKAEKLPPQQDTEN